MGKQKQTREEQNERDSDRSRPIHRQPPGYGKRKQGSGIHVLSFAIAERPILPRSLHKVYEQILRRQAWRFRKDFGHTLVEFAFLLRLPSIAQSDLNKNDAIGAVNAKVLR